MHTAMLQEERLTWGASTPEECLYGGYLPLLIEAIENFAGELECLRRAWRETAMRDPVCSWQARIKSRDSMVAKLERQGFEPTRHNALLKVFDAAGVRIVCPFVDDVDTLVDAVRLMPGFSVEMEKDYVRHPKANGYRSFHMVLATSASKGSGVWLEVQIRTIAMDCWANVEHQIKYKKEVAQQEMIVSELKRCADEMASTDLSLQTLADLIEPTAARR